MSRFNKNQTTPATQTTNLAGGVAYTEKPELALVSLLLTSFAQDQFYRTANETFIALKNLLAQVDPLFAAKALIYARKVFGMRSITHVGASELSRAISGTSWGMQFFNQIVVRPDDMTEIAAYHKAQGYKLTNAMRKGFALAFGRFDAYQLAKYRGSGKGVKLTTLVTWSHPRETQLIGDEPTPIRDLMKGELVQTDTWEARVSAAGKDKLKKAAAWADLVSSRKIGYLALVRNLRNIVEDAPEILNGAAAMLMDEKLVLKSRVFPFQFATASEELLKLNTKDARVMHAAVQKAFEISVRNVPRLDGEIAVILDTSSSMTQNGARPAQIGAVFAAVLCKSNNADLYTFDEECRAVPYNIMDSMGTIVQQMIFRGGGTSFHKIIPAFRERKYKRVIVLSDMQGWTHNPGIFSRVTETFRQQWNEYRRANPQAILYSFDLAGYGTLQVPEPNTYVLAGFSEKIFAVMKGLETDPDALINTVKAVVL